MFQSQSRSNQNMLSHFYLSTCAFLLGNPVSIKTFSTNTTVVEIIALVLFIIQIEFNRHYFKHSKSLLHLRNVNDKIEPCHEKSCLWGFQPGKTQACLQRLETLQGFELPILKIRAIIQFGQ